MISRLHAGFAAFEAEPSVKLPVALQDAIMAEDFDFCSCLERFGLTWTHCMTRFSLDTLRARAQAKALKKKAKAQKGTMESDIQKLLKKHYQINQHQK